MPFSLELSPVRCAQCATVAHWADTETQWSPTSLTFCSTACALTWASKQNVLRADELRLWKESQPA